MDAWVLGAGFALGAVTAGTVVGLRMRVAVVLAEEREAEARRRLEEERGLAAANRQALEDRFRTVAQEALRGSSEEFLRLAAERLGASERQGAAELEARKRAVESLLTPLRETLGKLEARTQEIETARAGAYARIDEQVRLLSEATRALHHDTTSLATALRGSVVRGRWGELALRNVAELAGMTEHCDFALQETGEGGGRPDMTVRLPGGRVIAVDAKVPLDAYLDAAEAEDEAARDVALDRHVGALRQRVRELAAREYAAAVGSDVDLVVLFLPGDPYLAAAFRRDPDLQVEALRRRVLVATPTTLVALLRTVAVYHQQHALARGAEEIAAAARELYDRGAKFGGDLARLGDRLRQAVETYNEAAGSFEARFLPMGRRLEELRVADGARRELAAPPRVAAAPRSAPS